MLSDNKYWNAWLWYLGAGGLITLGAIWIVLPVIAWHIHWSIGYVVTIFTLIGVLDLDN